ncbi:MAG: hypothetical protein ABW252_00560 [Polyangiales bacterium]
MGVLRYAIALVSLVLLHVVGPGPERGHAASRTLVVFVSRESPLREVSRAELRNLFLRHSSMIGPHTAIPVHQQPTAAARDKFDAAVLSMSEAELGRYWVDRRVRGESGPPRAIASLAVLLRVVAKLPGAVAYAYANEVDATVRVLRIDGKDPRDPSYPLH